MNYRAIKAVFMVFFFFFVFQTVSVCGEELQEFEGLIEPYEIVDVGTPVSGVVSSVDVKRSHVVTKGQPLVFLDSSVQSAVVEKARALAAVDGEITLQQERLSFAERMLRRVAELYESEAISAEKYDQAVTEVTLARARLQKAEENRRLAQLDLNRVRAILNQRTIKSPLSGVVVERFVSPGEFVDNKPLVQLAQIDPLRVEVILPAIMFAKIKPGMRADIVPEIQNDTKYSSTVTIVDKVIDPASGTFGVRLELPNKDYGLPSGLKCLVRFEDEANSADPARAGVVGDEVAFISGELDVYPPAVR